MDWANLARQVDASAARAFVEAARKVIDAMLIEAERARAEETPAECDYNAAELSRSAPAGGWLSHADLRRTAQQMAEAVAAERWTDGLVFALRLFGGR